MNNRKKNAFLIFFIFATMAATAFSVFAYISSSTNYRLEADSINLGGTRGTSSSFIIEDTLGEVGTGNSSSTNYSILAGYQQMANIYISLSVTTSAALWPPPHGYNGGISTTSIDATVYTDDPAGYVLFIKSSSSPALVCSASGSECVAGTTSFSDYTPTVSTTPDYDWSIPASSTAFGYSVQGTSIVTKFKDNGSACATGTNDTADKCWYDFNTTDEQIANSSNPTHPNGGTTTVKLKSEISASTSQPLGSYSAILTITAAAN